MAEKNNLRELRIEKMISQKELVELVNIPGFDVSMLSRIENGWCRPTADVEKSILRHLQATSDELYGEWKEVTGLWGVGTSTAAYEAVEDASWDCKELVACLKEGHRLAKGRRTLCQEMDMLDRNLRKVIDKAQREGFLIGNLSDGNGYFLIETVEEGLQYYRQENCRKKAVEERLRPLKKWLMENGAQI